MCLQTGGGPHGSCGQVSSLAVSQTLHIGLGSPHAPALRPLASTVLHVCLFEPRNRQEEGASFCLALLRNRPWNPPELNCSWVKGSLLSPWVSRSQVTAGDLTASEGRAMGINSTGPLTGQDNESSVTNLRRPQACSVPFS